MLVIPAIDLLAGRVVRLSEGKRESATVYNENPVVQAKLFAEQGAERLHVVDLDAAFSRRGNLHGNSDNRKTIADICAAVGSRLEVQVGGGLRDLGACNMLFALGVRRLVLGTAAVTNPAFMETACAEHPEGIIVAVDAKEGKVAISGWTEDTDLTPLDVARKACDAGAATILYTDIKRDGLRTGPNVAETAHLTEALHPVPVIASGGISSLDDLRALAAEDILQCVVGRALYERCFTLPEAIAAAKP